VGENVLSEEQTHLDAGFLDAVDSEDASRCQRPVHGNSRNLVRRPNCIGYLPRMPAPDTETSWFSLWQRRAAML